MPELRKDPIVGRWVIVATERARRPGNFVEKQNAFVDIIDASIDESKGEVVAFVPDNQNWKARVIKHNAPVFTNHTSVDYQTKGLYKVVNGYGVHEIVEETPEKIHNMADLSVEQIEAVIQLYAKRLNELRRNEKLKYAYIYKNYHAAVHDVQKPSTSQVLASVVIPLHILDKLRRSKSYYALHRRNIYADLLNQEIKARKRVIRENEHFVAFMPYASRFVFEVCIIPTETHCDFAEGIAGKERALAEVLKDVLLRFKVGLDDPSYTYVLNTSPFRHLSDETGRWKTLEKDYCWHIELTPRLTFVAGFEKGTGFHICSIPPEETADYLKGVKY